jgi:hypothetical protein
VWRWRSGLEGYRWKLAYAHNVLIGARGHGDRPIIETAPIRRSGSIGSLLILRSVTASSFKEGKHDRRLTPREEMPHLLRTKPVRPERPGWLGRFGPTYWSSRLCGGLRCARTSVLIAFGMARMSGCRSSAVGYQLRG